MTLGAFCPDFGAGSSVSPFLPGVKTLVMALPADLRRICHGEFCTIQKAEHFHISTVMAHLAGLVLRAEFIVAFQGPGVTTQAGQRGV